jgi:hypothetical protein
MSTLNVKNLQGIYPSNRVTVPVGHTLYAPGHILQVVYTRSNARTTTTSTTPVAIDSTMNLSITPSSSSSKIFIAYHIQVSGSYSALNNFAYIYRNSGVQLTYTNCYRIDYTNSAETTRTSLIYLDSPGTTSPTTYNLFLSAASASYNLQYNYASAETGDWGYSYGYAMEVAQ